MASNEKCPHAYRKRGDVAIHCKKQSGKSDYCGHTFLCPSTKRWEVSPQGETCTLRNK